LSEKHILGQKTLWKEFGRET